jgi:hypothetical protein
MSAVTAAFKSGGSGATPDEGQKGAVASTLVAGLKGPPPLPPLAPDAADEAVQAARTFERRRQVGLQGRMSTFLQTAQGESSGGSGELNAPTSILGA